MVLTFSLPLQRDELLEIKADPNEYRVRQIYPIRDLPTKLKDAEMALGGSASGGFTCLLPESEGGGDFFDVFFSVLVHFHKDLSKEAKRKAWEWIQEAFGGLVQTLDRELNAARDESTHEERGQWTVAMKMLVYLFTQMIEMMEANETSSSDLLMSKASHKIKKTLVSDNCVWDGEAKTRALLLLYRWAQLPLRYLFEPPIVEEEVINATANCLFRILENPSIALQRSKDLRQSSFQILGVLCSDYGYLLSCRLKIVQSLRHFEHLGSTLAEAVVLLARENGCSSVIMEIVRDLAQIDPQELQRDTSATRAYATFLTEITEAVPEMMKPCLSLLTLHLDGPSPSLRKCVLAILGEITLQVFGGESLEDAERETRDQFLDCLEDHIHDVHAHVRTSVLQIWTKLCSAKAIPLNRQQRLLKLVMGRLHDKSSNVRKQAVQLLTALLQCNPYRASMPVEELKEELEKETSKLRQLTGEPEEDMALKNLQMWEDNQEDVMNAIDEIAESPESEQEHEGEALWENASRNEVVLRIKHLLSKKKPTRAVELLRAALNHFPQDEIFIPKDDEQMETEHWFDLLKAIALFDSNAMDKNSDEEANEEINKQKVVVAYLQDSFGFAQLVNEALPTVAVLLGSKLSSDIMEAIQFFVSAFEFGVLNAMIGVRKMLALIWSQEVSVREAVLGAYKRLYVDGVDVNSKERAQMIVRNFIALVSGATVGELTSLEELVGMLVKSKDIGVDCFNLLWQYFTMMLPTVTQEESRGAIVLLGMVATVEPTVITTNLALLLETGLQKRRKQDLGMVHDICLALTKLGNFKVSSSDGQSFPGLKFDATHELFVSLEDILVEGVASRASSYIPMSQKAVSVIYQLSEEPDKILERILKRVSSNLFRDDQQIPTRSLSRLFALVGNVALSQLNHLEVSILNELKRRKMIKEALKERNSRKSIGGSARRNGRQSLKGEDGEDNLEVMGAEADDAEIEYIRQVCEKEVVSGPECLLSQFLPLVVHVASHPSEYSDPNLRASAGLALSKLMLVSSEVCDEHLQLLFTLMEKSQEEVIRANLIIATGDLSFRFPNILEPWTPRMYARLRDDSTLVRSNTLNVLTLLILNDMIKVKGQISDMALCIDDGNEKISGLAKQFFTELARKGNALYNVMPDIISRLSDVASGVSEEKFRTILSFIVGLIEKDKHLESLVEKLCHRFRATQSSRQWRDLSYCLSLFSFNEKALKKLQDNFACLSDKLHDESVYNSISGILVQSRKNIRVEAKVMIEEIEEKLDEARKKCLEDYAASSRAVAAKDTSNKDGRKQE
ncbi:condensin complex subunit 1-like isoform X2 [Tigriopus californicus]|uniref:condensin complex subunit 1-like isoform X2 n=1 Tax=Tigriopus californicus TaxID=6832 RepID=UPI0027DA6603|nr:condensin complex subunit 1-like isoform X2 [Tigriopus californicus]